MSEFVTDVEDISQIRARVSLEIHGPAGEGARIDMPQDFREGETEATLVLRRNTVRLIGVLSVVFSVLGVNWARGRFEALREAPIVTAYLIVCPAALASAVAVGKACRWVARMMDSLP